MAPKLERGMREGKLELMLMRDAIGDAMMKVKSRREVGFSS